MGNDFFSLRPSSSVPHASSNGSASNVSSLCCLLTTTCLGHLPDGLVGGCNLKSEIHSLKGMDRSVPSYVVVQTNFLLLEQDAMMRKQGGLRNYQERSVDGVDDAGTASHLPCSRFVCKRGLSEYEECFKQIFEVRLLERD